MAHEVETMAYANEVPWHGLGQRVAPDTTPEEMLRAAGLDWRVEKMPLRYKHGDRTLIVPERMALVRATDGQLMDIVGKDWKPHQNEDTFKVFIEMCKIGKATMETAGSLRNGQIIWGLANLKHGFKTPKGDAVKGYVFMGSYHKFGKASMMATTAVRVVCANTHKLMMQGQREIEIRVTHANEFNPDMVRHQFELAHESMSEYERNVKLLTKLNMSRDDAVRVLAPVYQSSTDVEDLVTGKVVYNNPMNRVLEAMLTAPGALPGTGWGVMNGVTYYADHVAGRNADARMQSAWLGQEAKRKDDVFQRLLELV